MKFKVGDKVKWNDPGINDYPKEERKEALNRVFEIYSINGEVISISDGITEAEVLEDELKKIRKKIIN